MAYGQMHANVTPKHDWCSFIYDWSWCSLSYLRIHILIYILKLHNHPMAYKRGGSGDESNETLPNLTKM